MFKNIPLNRLALYIGLAGLLPIILAVIHFNSNLSKLDEIENTLETVRQLAANRQRKQAINIAVRNNFREGDHFYIDKQLETLTFLDPEVESLQKVTANKNFPDDENIKKRLEFLTGKVNHLVFTEGNVQSTPTFQEVTETLTQPVEVNVEDLKTILAKIEGTDIGTEAPGPNRPQLIILDLKLDKKHLSDKNEVFQLNLKLLKREFT